MGETNATGEMRAAMIGHDASSAIASSALPGKKTTGRALPPVASSNGGGGGASPSYGTGTNSTPPSPTPKPQNGGANKLLNANPQGVAPKPPAQAPGFSADTSTKMNRDSVIQTSVPPTDSDR